MNEVQRMIDAASWWDWVLCAYCGIGLLLFTFVMVTDWRRPNPSPSTNPVDPPGEDLHASHGGFDGCLTVFVICMCWPLGLVTIVFERLKYGRR